MRSGSSLALQIAVCTLVLAGPALAAGAASGGALEAGETTLRFDLRADGNATVTVVQRYSLDGPNETEAFRDLAAEFERGEDVGPSVAPFRRASSAASEATGRPMSVGNVTRNATVADRDRGDGAVGRLAVSFRWSNFSRVEGARLIVGDAFRTPDGTWLPGLEADQRLIISLPDDYVLRSARGQWTIRDGALVWPGPATFDDGDLEIVAEHGSGSSPPTTTPTPGTNGTDATDTDPGNPLGGTLPPLFGGVALVVGVTALGAYALAAREGWTAAGLGGDGDPGAGARAGGTGPDPGSGPGADHDSGPASGGGEGAGAGAGAGGPVDDDGIDEELLSDEERVERLLRRNDGRMRQADIVTETDWSNAKVSQLLSSMDEEDRIDKLRIGRENLISLPEVDTVDPDGDEE